MTTTQDLFPSKNTLEKDLVQDGFRPLLYTVIPGSYASDAVYGSGDTMVNNYASKQLSRGTSTVPLVGTTNVVSKEGCDYQRKDKKVDFTLNITLNSTLADPAFGATHELRIKPYIRTSVEPAVYRKGLPLPQRDQPLPLFAKTEITDKNGVPVLPNSGTGVKLYTRMLQSGDLALISRNLLTYTDSALTNDQIQTRFGLTNQVTFINISGEYLCQNF